MTKLKHNSNIYIDQIRLFRAAEDDYGEIAYTMIYEGAARLEEAKPYVADGTLIREYVVFVPDDSLQTIATDKLDIKTACKDWGSLLNEDNTPLSPNNLNEVIADGFNVPNFGTKIYLKSIYR